MFCSIASKTCKRNLEKSCFWIDLSELDPMDLLEKLLTGPFVN